MSSIFIDINGKKEQLSKQKSIRALLEERSIDPSTVACELNEKIIRRSELDKVVLKDGDVLEIIRMIGGG